MNAAGPSSPVDVSRFLRGVPVFPSIVRTLEAPAGRVPERPPPVAFHHIPKTAGSTFRRMLEQLFEPEEVCPAEVDDELPEGLNRAQYRLFAGHFSFAALQRLPADTVRLTFVRNPIQRIVSEYYNVSSMTRFPARWLERIDASPAMRNRLEHIAALDLSAYLQSDDPGIRDHRINRQTRYLADNDEARPIDLADGWNHAREVAGRMDESRLHAPELLESAKRNLVERFAFVGTQEDFTLSLALFAMTLGLRPLDDPAEVTVNQNPERRDREDYQIAPAIRTRLEQENLLDLELWRFARGLVHQRLGVFAAQALHDMRWTDTRRDAPGIEQPPLPERLEIRADQLHAPRGFHRVERDGLGRTFRWTGWESVAAIEFAADLSPYRTVVITLDLLSAITPQSSADLTVSFDDIEARRVEHQPHDTGIRLRFVAEPGRRRIHEIALKGPRHLEPEKPDGRRWLGVAVHSIEIAPACDSRSDVVTELCSTSPEQSREERR